MDLFGHCMEKIKGKKQEVSIILDVTIKTRNIFLLDDRSVQEQENIRNGYYKNGDYEYEIPYEKIINQTKKNFMFTEYIDKTYGPFIIDLPKLDNNDMYKFMLYIY